MNRRNKRKFNQRVNKQIIKKYGQGLLNYIESIEDKFYSNWFKFAVLRVNFNDEYDNVYHFLSELKSLKNKDVDLRSKRKLYDLVNKYLEPSEVEKKESGEVYTSFSIIYRNLDMFPKEMWKDPYQTIIDGASGIGNYQVVILERYMEGLKDYKDGKIDLRKDRARYKWIMENIIYTCDISDKNTFLYKNIFDPNDEIDLKHYYGDFLSPKFINQMKIEWKKPDGFDKSTGNPPWNQNIDLKFLTRYYEISNECSIVHPATWLFDKKNTQTRFTNIKNLIGDDLSKSILINGNANFKNVQLFVPCTLTYIRKNTNSNRIEVIDEINNTKIYYDNIYNVNKYNSDEYFSIMSKLNFSESLLDNLNYKSKNKPKYKNIVNVAQIRGHVSLKDKNVLVLPDFYTIVTKDSTITNIPKKHMFFEFLTKKESENFEKYLKTKFVRFCLSTLKNNSQLDRGELKNIPWLDFTEEWTDKKLRSRYDISDKEWDFIDSVIPDYY